MSEPVVRLQSLRTLVLSEIVLPASLRAKCSGEALLERIDIVSQSARAAMRRLATADAARMPRLSIDDLVRALTFLVFREFATELSLDKLECQVHRELRDLSPLEERLLRSFVSLLGATSHWMLGFYTRVCLHKAVEGLPAVERDEFFRLCNELAKVFHDSFGSNPASAESTEGERRRHRILDRLRELRTLALAAAAKDDMPSPSGGSSATQTSTRSLHWVQLGFDDEHPVYGVIAMDCERVHLWCSEQWSKSVAPLAAMAADSNILLDNWNTALKQFNAENSFGAGEIFSNRDLALSATIIQVADHTRCGLPLACILDPLRAFSWSTCVPDRNTAQATAIGDRRVCFWGQIEYRAKSRITANETRREILYELQTRFIYPDNEIVGAPMKGIPRPLPYAYFERWFLEDACKSLDLDVCCRCADYPTRKAFLNEVESGGGILHVTTHGHVDLNDVEYSHLLLAREGDQPTVVHALDILAHDWSTYDVVLLNACLTSAGKKPVGEELLSLAWGFLAGGARAVIGCRWPVDDKVAWKFCRAFYEHYFEAANPNDDTLRQAFANAVRTLNIERPGDWGSFVLLS